jgi:hypothetical protein
VQNVLRSLSAGFDSKISALEERTDLDTLEMDELHGILTAYEMILVRILSGKKHLSR